MRICEAGVAGAGSVRSSVAKGKWEKHSVGHISTCCASVNERKFM